MDQHGVAHDPPILLIHLTLSHCTYFIEGILRSCGSKIPRGNKECLKCWKRETVKKFNAGRKLAQCPEAIAKRSETMLQHREKIRNWNALDLPARLTRDVYMNQVQPALVSVPKSRIRSELGVSEPYSSYIQEGKRIPASTPLTGAGETGGCFGGLNGRIGGRRLLNAVV